VASAFRLGADERAALAFERQALVYEGQVARETLRLQRRHTHASLARRFPPGCRLLEIGCGAGHDTAFLVARGATVVACDPADAMLALAERRVREAGGAARVRFLRCGLEGAGGLLEVIGGRFDGIVSNFGALNCTPDLAPLRELALRHLRPGGTVVLGLLGRVCLWEAARHAARRSPAAGWRRPESALVGVAGIDVATRYHATADVARALGEAFRLVERRGIGVIVAPPAFDERWRRLPAPVRSAAARVEGWIGGWAPWNRLGDHVLLHFEKRRHA
jgi:SAM-dependent methyltransferase